MRTVRFTARQLIISVCVVSMGVTFALQAHRTGLRSALGFLAFGSVLGLGTFYAARKLPLK